MRTTDIVPAGPPPALAQYERRRLLRHDEKEPHFAKMTICLGYEKNDAPAKSGREKSANLHV